jgi:hypothetical protein
MKRIAVLLATILSFAAQLAAAERVFFAFDDHSPIAQPMPAACGSKSRAFIASATFTTPRTS